jgi:hypothetical protein
LIPPSRETLEAVTDEPPEQLEQAAGDGDERIEPDGESDDDGDEPRVNADAAAD